MVATFMGHEAVRLLAEGKTNRIVAMRGDDYVNYDVEEALHITKGVNQQLYGVMRMLAGQ